ncbi:hypothetical protein VN97_g7445 [Penicillium thymicola]|uniref:Uncharacterized protein n=1 Tax=Penicillium thymicola TaxID=293382 RepID=A0AAI9TEZ7_PENTH|nr:hypothetical protein VN97_g7445 [Penicillium thymicola]
METGEFMSFFSLAFFLGGKNLNSLEAIQQHRTSLLNKINSDYKEYDDKPASRDSGLADSAGRISTVIRRLFAESCSYRHVRMFVTSFQMSQIRQWKHPQEVILLSLFAIALSHSSFECL